MQRLLILTCLIVIAVVGCRQQAAQTTDETDLNIELQVEPEDAAVGEATLVITISDGDGNPVNDAKVAVRGDMSHAGMTPVLGDVENGENGVYRLPFEWTMAGDWIVEVTAELPDDVKVTETFELSVAGDSDMDMDMGGDSGGEVGDDSQMDMGGDSGG